MTNRNYYTPSNNTNNSAYSGEITIEDFNTYSPNKKRINNQIEATNLHKAITEKKNKEKKYKDMTLEELREMRLISNTDGRPASWLTDESWQKEFNVRRMFVKPYPKEIKKMQFKYSIESGRWNEETTYHGYTNWQQYCTYINDVLRNIRCGQVDYCYYIFQITDLLKFHLDDLRTKYCDGYWEVWLEKGVK